MKLSLKLKVILLYTLSPFFTGYILFFIYGVNDLLFGDEFNLVSTLIGAPLGLGLVALIVFFIPAMIVGRILWKFTNYNNFFRLILSALVGFIIPYLLFSPMSEDCSSSFKEFGGLLNCYYAARNMGVLGGITSFLVTLKLIIYPFQEIRTKCYDKNHGV